MERYDEPVWPRSQLYVRFVQSDYEDFMNAKECIYH